MGTTDQALIRAREQIDALRTGSGDVMLGLVSVVADLTAVVATLVPAADAGATGESDTSGQEPAT